MILFNFYLNNLFYILLSHKLKNSTENFDICMCVERKVRRSLLRINDPPRGSLLAHRGIRVLEKYHRIMNIHADESRDQSER